MSRKVLITAPLKQEVEVFRAYQNALDHLIIPKGVEVGRHYIVNDCPQVIPYIKGTYEEINTGDYYGKTSDTHIWRPNNLSKMPRLRNASIKASKGYDYWFSIDTDLVLEPETLEALLDADKDVVSEVFWTEGTWWCNAWMYDQCDPADQLERWKAPGLYQVGGTGALTLVKTKVFEKADYTPIPCIKNALWGEDRWFSIRCACHGIEMWLDTHCPATHLYTDKIFKNWRLTHDYSRGNISEQER